MEIEKEDQEDTSYSDEYDRQTVELCREFEATHLVYDTHELAAWLLDVPLFFLRGERYADKSKSIDSLRNAIQECHRKLEEAQPKFKVLCLVCRSRMNLVEKLPYGSGKEEQILFYFKCGGCRELRQFFEDGTEHRPQPPSCDKCGAKFEKKHTREGNKITTAFSCRACGHSKDEVLDLDNILDKPESKIDEKFLEDRKRFCMTEEEGKEYLHDCYEYRHPKKKESSEDVAIKMAVKQINILNIAQAQELLTPLFIKNGLKDLEFGKSEICGRSIMLPYTAQDTLSGRDRRTAPKEIHRLIEKAFQNTNWRPTSEVTYNLGLISGKIRGMESESDLRKLVQKKVSRDKVPPVSS